MKSTLIELPPDLFDSADNPFVDLEFIDELEVAPERRERLFKSGAKFGEYSVIGFIAAGGMGEVYAAERIMPDGKRLGPVALKVMAPDYRDDWMVTQRFKREAQIARSIRSVHVPRLFEFGETDDKHLFLVMELLKGEELFDRLCQRYRLTDMEVARLSVQVLEGLASIHTHGFVHRDIKPENIYFHQIGSGEEVVKILDFGIAKLANEESDPYLSVVGRVYGTPEYIAPEQGLNPDVDVRADLYSVGVIMYECLTGSLPFDGETPYVTILAHQTEPVPALPSTIDPELSDIVYRALEKDADDRYQTAEEMAEVIRYWIQDHEDDDLGVSLRDSGDLISPTTQPLPEPRETPAPTATAERARRPRRVVQTGQVNMKEVMAQQGVVTKQPKPNGIDLEQPVTDDSLPPVQIFSKPKRARADESNDLAEVSESAANIAKATTKEHELNVASKRSSLLPTIVTALAIILVIVAIAWSFM